MDLPLRQNANSFRPQHACDTRTGAVFLSSSVATSPEPKRPAGAVLGTRALRRPYSGSLQPIENMFYFLLKSIVGLLARRRGATNLVFEGHAFRVI